MRSVIGALSIVIAAGVVAGTAVAMKGATADGTGIGSVFVSNPVQSLGNESLTDQKDSDAAVPAAAYYDVQLTNLDGSGYPERRLRPRLQQHGQPRVLADEHVSLHAPPGRVRAGDGLLLGHRGAEVHPGARVRDVDARDRQPAAEREDRPVGRRQLVRDQRPQEERAPLREGRRRRRRGRRGDPPRVRARHPLRAELLVRVRRGGRDQRGLRRLLGGHRLRRRRDEARRPRA